VDILADTNILLRRIHRGSPQHRQTRDAINRLSKNGYRFCVASQNLIELWAVCTKGTSHFLQPCSGVLILAVKATALTAPGEGRRKTSAQPSRCVRRFLWSALLRSICTTLGSMISRASSSIV
jgi:predicted nucleic acid-binding protein